MSWKVLLILLLIYMVLVLLGGVAFHFLELPAEDSVRIDLRSVLDRFTANHQCVNRTEMEVLLKAAIEAYSAGVLATQNATSSSNWDYPAAIFFANTVVTTIGYGNISPSTLGGKVFCVIFACVGIPLTAIILAAMGEKLSNGIKKVETKCINLNKTESKFYSILTPILVFLFGFTMFMIIPAGIFVALEQWTYGDSLYYAFITLTTIGFGDFVAGQNASEENRGWYRIFLWFWIVVGLAWLATVISRLQEIFKTPVDKVEAVLDKKRDQATTSETELGGVNGSYKTTSD